MPASIASLIAAEDDSNSLVDVVPKLAQLLEHKQDLDAAYLCSNTVVQVYKLKDEGAHFCGYRNMQMLCLALRDRQDHSQRNVDLTQKLRILELQTLIEKAWDAGINAHGRKQTGGVVGTRKHVGTSEAEALLLSLGIECTGSAFEGKTAYVQLLDAVGSYFSADQAANTQVKVRRTTRPPVFFQRPGHSMTIVGLEELRDGRRKLLVFDPAWRPPSAMRREEEVMGPGWKTKMVLKQYEKSERYLKKWREFEILTVN